MGMKNVGLDYLTDEQRKLVEENINLVYHQANKKNITDEDLIQEGMLALVNAARFYSPEFGVKFGTYAASYIWAAFLGTYSDKKYKKNKAVTDSFDDNDLNIPQPSYDPEVTDFVEYLNYGGNSLAKEIVSYICGGLRKSEIAILLNLDVSQINSILKTVGKENYGNRKSVKHSN